MATDPMPGDDPKLVMARSICARIVEGDSDSPLRVAEANRYLAGKLDDLIMIQIALAAIEETTERSARGGMQRPDGTIPTISQLTSDLSTI